MYEDIHFEVGVDLYSVQCRKLSWKFRRVRGITYLQAVKGHCIKYTCYVVLICM
jgi:hypothetical protein